MITSFKNKLKTFTLSSDPDEKILHEDRKRKRESPDWNDGDMLVVSSKNPKIQASEPSVFIGLLNCNTFQVMSDWVKGKRPNFFSWRSEKTQPNLLSWHSERTQPKCHNGNGYNRNKTLHKEDNIACSSHHRFMNSNRSQDYNHGTMPSEGSIAVDALTISLRGSATHIKRLQTDSELGNIVHRQTQLPFSGDLFATRNKHTFTARESVRLDDKVRYQQLLQQFTMVPLEQHEPCASSSETIKHSVRAPPLPWSKNSILGTTSTKDVYSNEKSQMLERPTLKVHPRQKATQNHHAKGIALIEDSVIQFTDLSHTATEHPDKHLQSTSTAYIDEKERSGRVAQPNKDSFISPIAIARTIKSPTNDYRESKFLSENWIKDLTSTYSSRARERDRQLAEAKIKTKLYDERQKQYEDDLEEKMHKQMHIYKNEAVVVEDLPVEFEDEDENEIEDKLPELTKEMENKINNWLQPGHPGEILVEKFRLQIRRSDIATLCGLNWINDEIINFYMNLLMERGGKYGKPKVYAFNTFFYPKVMSGGQTAVKRWTRQVDILAVDYILIPVHLGVHWCLAVIDFKRKDIQYYDSMGGSNPQCLNTLKKYLCDESLEKKKKEFDLTGWKSTIVKNIPQQMNGSDCGMFACKYAEYITREAPISFTQQHMPYFRKRMVYEIVTEKLLQ